MDLPNLRPYYAAVTPESLADYLREHGWTSHPMRDGRTSWWTSPRNHGALLSHEITNPDPGLYGGPMLVIASIANDEERPETAVLYDVLPAHLRRAFALELLPQLAEVLNEVRVCVAGLLAALPDTMSSDDESWGWAWNELSEEAQDIVKARRAAAAALLAQLSDPAEPSEREPEMP
jgi:hypothetical protein